MKKAVETLREGMRIRLTDGCADVLRVTECSATVRYVEGQVREFVRPLSGQVVRFASAGRTVTISPHSECEILHREALTDRMQAPLKGDGGELFAPPTPKARKA